MTIAAEIVLDSVSPEGHCLTTFKLRYPRFIHDELLTHRVFSRNACSSRAVPTEKRIREAREAPAMPVYWGKNKPGMQAAEEHSTMVPFKLHGDPEDDFAYYPPDRAWKQEARHAANRAEAWSNAGYHKQIVNRLLDPFVHIDVVVTATEYMNFFGLRLDAGAQPEMRALAEAMWTAYDASIPNLLAPGYWHLPFITMEDCDGPELQLPTDGFHVKEANDLIKVSVARCARTSYLSFDTGKRSTVEEDLVLYDKLMRSQPLHASPAEHQATPDFIDWENFAADARKDWQHPRQHGNFTGWRQYRKMLEGEAIAPLPNTQGITA